MSIIFSRGYDNNSTVEDVDRDWQLFSQNIDLLLNNEQKILNVANYFFCSPAFSSCSFPYISGDGQLFLGYLLLGWQADILTEKCPACALGKVSITFFGGSPLSGNNSWTGICLSCRQKQKGIESKHFRLWMDLILKLRQTFPDKVCEQEEYLGQEFSWGGRGLRPIMKKRIVWKPVANPIALTVVIEELTANNVRRGPINISLLKKEWALKLSRPLQKDVHIKL